MVLRVDPEELETQAVKIEGLALQFGSDLDTEKSNVEAMDWDGDAGVAFVGMFQEARERFRDVEDSIADIASLLRHAKADLENADRAVADAIRNVI
jgi:WXG100 family type VII secretion target